MVRQNQVLPYLTQKWYGNCRAVRTNGAAHEPCPFPPEQSPYRWPEYITTDFFVENLLAFMCILMYSQGADNVF